MNLLLLEENEIRDDNTVSLRDRRSEHILNILNSGPGDRVRAGIVNGPVGTAEILSVQEKGGKARVLMRFFAGNEEKSGEPDVDLIMGLVRPIMLKRILLQAAALGVGRIFLINGRRVEKSFFGASLLKDENYRPYLIQGLEQARDTRLPRVSVHKRFKPFVEDFIPVVAGDYDRMLVAHPDNSSDLKKLCAGQITGKTLLAVGPEGGWVDFEVEKFIEQAFVPVSLGRRILRADTAVVALLAQLMLLRRQA